MGYLCKKQIRLGGTEYHPGETIPDGAVLENRARTLKANGYIVELQDENSCDVSPIKEDIYSFKGAIQIPIIKRNGEDGSSEMMSLPMKPEELQQALSVMQMNAEEGSREIQKIEEENVLILIHAADSRTTIKNAAKKQADILNSSSENKEMSEEEGNGDA